MKLYAMLALGVSLLPGAEYNNRSNLNYQLGSGPARLIVDTIWGGIDVEPGPPGKIEVVVDEHWKADLESELAEARQLIKLIATQEGNTVKLFVDSPNRHNDDNNRRRWNRLEAKFDFHIRAPRDLSLEAKTVLSGDINIRGIRGEMKIGHVNGPVKVTDIAGHGDFTTVNGPLQVTFTELPDGPCNFKTVNGTISTAFPRGLNANGHAETLNGDIWSDFEYSTLPVAAKAEMQGTRYSYKHRGADFKIGAGGQAINYSTINGKVLIEERGK